MGAAVYCREVASSLFQQGAERHPSTEKGIFLSCKAPWAQARWTEPIWWQEQGPSYKCKVTKKTWGQPRKPSHQGRNAGEQAGQRFTCSMAQADTRGMTLSWNGAAGPKGRGVVQIRVRLFRAIRACHCAQGPYIYCILQYIVVEKKKILNLDTFSPFFKCLCFCALFYYDFLFSL